jgi:hypothetical protein
VYKRPTSWLLVENSAERSGFVSSDDRSGDFHPRRNGPVWPQGTTVSDGPIKHIRAQGRLNAGLRGRSGT